MLEFVWSFECGSKLLIIKVPKAGIEPARRYPATDFESVVSTNSTTSAK